MKKCTKCGKLKDEKEFIGDRGKIVKKCRMCREYMKVYYARNKDQLKTYSKEYREQNKEQLKGYFKEYREQMKGRIQEYRKRNKIRRIEYSKEYNRRSAKYETYAHKLTVEESPKKGKNGILLVRCTKCGSYFTPTILEVKNRVKALEGRGSAGGEHRLYCSQACKDACEIYGVNYDPYAKHASVERDPAWAKMVKERANFICERCGSTENLEAHHEIPVKLNPELVSDEDNGICLCHDCHKKAHAEEGCTLADLRSL